MKVFTAFDPGSSSGGFAAIDEIGQVLKTFKFADLTEQSIWHEVREFTTKPEVVGLAVVEDVHSMPDQGVASAFSFGTSFGFLRGIMAASNCPYEFVSPQKWQKPFALPTTKVAGSKTAKKNAHKAAAERLFPGTKIIHGNADALLMAEWARRTYAQRLIAPEVVAAPKKTKPRGRTEADRARDNEVSFW